MFIAWSWWSHQFSFDQLWRLKPPALVPSSHTPLPCQAGWDWPGPLAAAMCRVPARGILEQTTNTEVNIRIFSYWCPILLICLNIVRIRRSGCPFRNPRGAVCVCHVSAWARVLSGHRPGPGSQGCLSLSSPGSIPGPGPRPVHSPLSPVVCATLPCTDHIQQVGHHTWVARARNSR